MTSVAYIYRSLDKRRRDLGMPLKYVSERAKVSPGTVQRVLAGDPGARIETVTAIGDALGVPDLNFPGARRPPNRMRRSQAALKARKIVGMVQGTSALEAQALSDADRKLMIENTISELLSGPRSQLWASM